MVSEFLDLNRQANHRIAKAIESAEAVLMEDFFVACQRYNTVLQRSKAGQGTPDGCRSALREVEHAILDARAKAALSIIDSITVEYLNAATDHQDFIDRLHRVVPMRIAEILPERSIWPVLHARFKYWETQAPWKPSDQLSRRVRRGRVGIPVANKVAALQLKLSGKTYAECATTLYGVPTPNAQQRRSVASILKNFQNSPDCPALLKQLLLSAKQHSSPRKVNSSRD